MSDLDRALEDIRGIRLQVAKSTEFRGYGALTLLCTAALAAVAGAVQARFLPAPGTHPLQYVAVWTTTALVAVALIATQALTRAHRMHSGLADEMLLMAAGQFAPSLLAGMLTTILLLRFSPGTAWLLPGLWQILSSLGIFASCRFLPRQVLGIGIWYLMSGLFCITLGANALSPFVMACGYGVGQTLFGVVIYISSKENHDVS